MTYPIVSNKLVFKREREVRLRACVCVHVCLFYLPKYMFLFSLYDDAYFMPSIII